MPYGVGVGCVIINSWCVEGVPSNFVDTGEGSSGKDFCCFVKGGCSGSGAPFFASSKCHSEEKGCSGVSSRLHVSF